MPNGTKITAAVSHGISAWARITRISVILKDGTPKTYFLKCATRDTSRALIEGEYHSVVAIDSLVPGLVPKAIGWGSYGTSGRTTFFYLGDFVVMDLDSPPDPTRFASLIAELHRKGASLNGLFGFPVATVCGKMQRPVSWEQSWAKSFTNHLQAIIDYDNKANKPWHEYDAACKQLIEVVIPRLLGVLQTEGRQITPTLIHGDLWENNIGIDKETGNIILFDPGSIYAHNEMEFGTWRCSWATHFKSPEYQQLYKQHIPPSEPVEDAFNDMLFLCEKYGPVESLEKYDPEKDISVTGAYVHFDILGGNFRKSFGFRKKSSEKQPLRKLSPLSVSSESSSIASNLNNGDESALYFHPHLEEIVDTGFQTSATPKTSEFASDPLGLNVVYTPESGHKVDIVFVHGLGGTSRLSWSKHKNLELLWPLTFLPLEPDICLARILTFGYNATITKAGNVSTSVLDFAKSLLFSLKYGTNEQKGELNMGKVPLIFVVHSMGGLIVKEAYMQGQNDPEHEDIIKSISVITFLSTPHRGTNLAEILNLVLQSTFISNSKQYIAELAKNSFTLQRLNEQFRHIAPKLDIISFYEPQHTSIGLRNFRIMILERDSSVLGYPREISVPLDADHHGVCKYDSPSDPNYIMVRNVLKSLVRKIIAASRSDVPVSSPKDSQDLKSSLAITELPDTDYVFFRDQWTSGTINWILEDPAYLDWILPGDKLPRILWLEGAAAVGKSVLSSFIINNIIEQGACCQYFFIRFGDQSKRTLSKLLRSIAFQMAQSIPEFQRKVLHLVDETTKFRTADPRAIWERIFKSILFKMEINYPIYWVIDGIEEADDPRTVIKIFSEVSTSLPIRILLVGRKTSEITAALQKIPRALGFKTIRVGGILDDFVCYIRQELDMSGIPQFREELVKMIIQGAQNNFLWVRLAVEKLNLCHTTADVERTLKDLPHGMEALYDRMASGISENISFTEKALAKTILECVSSSLRVLTVAELSQAVDKDTLEILDFQRSIATLCGGVVVIDNNGNVAMIHRTAREYLLGGDRPFNISREAANERLFLSLLVQASKHLSKFSAKRKDYDAMLNPNDRQILQRLCDGWTTDLAKISLTYQLFGKKESNFLSVTGLSSEDWDDSLARLSVGSHYSSSITVSGGQVAVLSGSGTVTNFSSSTSTQAGSIDHGERVYRMGMNDSATLVATYGYRTTKVWELTTGRCQLVVSNIETKPRPLAIKFSRDDNTLLVGMDDRVIRSLDLIQNSESKPTWQVVAELEEPEIEGHFLNSASYMALSDDGSLAAVAYRGQPISVEIIGLYTEGVIFKWRPYEDETSEIFTGASKLAISSDGNVFVTGDVYGTVKVYSSLDFRLIYHLGSQDTVLGLAFGPDVSRFYDIGGYYANVWEPNALMKLAEQTEWRGDSASETESLARKSAVSTSLFKRINSLTTLIASPASGLYCFGTEKGTVHLYDVRKGKLADVHASKSFMSIEQMSWSSNGKAFCF
ncbi:hypothetical protein HYALB_00007707 [Hymenoscyphus albidus]|uniref:protein-ribulosamine 3-kinase n=1 Tax=Hymenoscyphus albidus TaxID=595503 RepID=A0A9N9Q3U7_9HELO|nr:hypothetical protein HYALB_00007707 [Hymenoscyphus albidus]